MATSKPSPGEAMAATKETLNEETNARFWAQTNHRPGQKLDMSDPTDRKMAKIWKDIFRKVKAEDDAGQLVLTFDHPVVREGLSDAAVADKAAAIHVEAAAAASDPAVKQQNIEAATAATQIRAQKAREVAALQPATVSSKLAQKVARDVARTPPPPSAPASEQIAHAQALSPPATARDAAVQETNRRFWEQTGYKPGQKLDMADPNDRAMSRTWMSIFRMVQEGAPPRMPAPAPFVPSAPAPSGNPLVQETNRRFWAQTGHKPGQRLDMTDPADRAMSKVWMQIFQTVRAEAAGEGFAAMPPMPPAPTPEPTPEPTPMPDVVDVDVGPVSIEPVATETAAMEAAAKDAAARAKVTSTKPEKKGLSAGTIALLGAAVVALGGAGYFLLQKLARKPSRPRAPRVILATPAHLSPARARAMPAFSARGVPRRLTAGAR